MNHTPPVMAPGIPTLSGRTPDNLSYPADPILCFDRNEDDTPRARLKYRLDQRGWRPDAIESFLDRLGFKP